MVAVALAGIFFKLVNDPVETNEVALWNRTLIDFTRLGSAPPPYMSRNMAILSIAQFDALNAISGHYRAYKYSPPQKYPGASERAAVLSASVTVLLELSNSRRKSFELYFKQTLAELGQSQSVKDGLRIGEESAKAILEARRYDGTYLSDGTNPVSEAVGLYRESAHADVKPATPFWGKVQPFCLAKCDEFRPPQIHLNSRIYIDAFNEVKEFGGQKSTKRTIDQGETAKFWAFGGGTITPPGAWNQIASGLVIEKKFSLLESSRTFALLNMALADASIAAWECKYTYKFWRPISAINLADTDGVDETIPDKNWVPFLATPNHPSYVSGHSTFSTAGATILTAMFGDNVSFTYKGDPHFNVKPRTYKNFQQAAEEAGQSRIYGGIHFQFDNQAGLKIGRQVAQEVLSMELNPVAEISPFTGK
jgi:hypothetical protein